MSISDEKLEEIQAELEGTCEGLSAVIDRHELDIDESGLEDRLLDGSLAVERCGGCEWWFRVSGLEHDEETGRSECEQCNPKLHET